MPAASSIIAAVGVGIAGASAGFGAHHQREMRHAASDQRKEQRAQVAQAERAFAEEKEGTRRQEEMRRARARQLALMRAGTTGQDFTRTAGSAQPSGGKTLLGM